MGIKELYSIIGKANGKTIIRDDLRRTVAAVSYCFGRTSGMLEKLIYGNRY